jgi:hypothetical protein
MMLIHNDDIGVSFGKQGIGESHTNCSTAYDKVISV